MKGLQLRIEGNWAHFRKPETNNNPLTHDFITKTALVGLVGAILGKEREEMRHLFPQLCEDLLYGVQVINPVKKEAWGFTSRKAENLMEKGRKNMEFLKNPKYQVSIALRNQTASGIFQQFLEAIKHSEAHFQPVLGLHNCPASLGFVSEGTFSEKQHGDFTAGCFVSRQHQMKIDEKTTFRVGLDRIPTFQNDSFWNLPDRYVEVIYPSVNQKISVTGDFYQYENGEKWWLV